MTTGSDQAPHVEEIPRRLLVAVLVLTVMVVGLGAAVIVVKLRPAGMPTTKAELSLSEWRSSVAANPDASWAQTGLGLALLDAGRPEEAEVAFEEALARDAEDWMAQFQLGVLTGEKDPVRAESLLASAGESAPRTERAAPLVALGSLRLERGDAAGAQQAFEEALDDLPFLVDAHVGLAKTLEALGDEAGALEEYRSAARYDPTNQEVGAAISRLQAGETSATEEDR